MCAVVFVDINNFFCIVYNSKTDWARSIKTAKWITDQATMLDHCLNWKPLTNSSIPCAISHWSPWKWAYIAFHNQTEKFLQSKCIKKWKGIDVKIMGLVGHQESKSGETEWIIGSGLINDKIQCIVQYFTYSMNCDRHGSEADKTYLTESRSLEATPFLLHRADTHILLMPTLAGWGVVLGDKNKPGLSLAIPKQKKSHAVASFWFEYHIS